MAEDADVLPPEPIPVVVSLVLTPTGALGVQPAGNVRVHARVVVQEL
jgi:hypothetical protein